MARTRKPPDALDIAALSKAQAAHEAEGLPTYNGPLYQAVARQILEDCRKAFAAGDERALVTAMNQCALRELVMPPWLATEWLRRAQSISLYEAASWDEVLPVAKPKGRKLAALRLERRWMLPVVHAVYEAAGPYVATEKRAAIDEQLFDELAERKRWPFSGAQAKALYYAARNNKAVGTAHYFEAMKARAPRRRSATSTIRRKS